MRLMLLFGLIFWFAGCAPKQPEPDTAPSPMTEEYLRTHMSIVHLPHLQRTQIETPPIRMSTVFAEANATLVIRPAIEVYDPPSVLKPKFHVIVSIIGYAWGEFDEAIDLQGKRWSVQPFTSSIRDGIYYETFTIPLEREWFAHFATGDPTLLLLGERELTVTIPAVYLQALSACFDEWKTP